MNVLIFSDGSRRRDQPETGEQARFARAHKYPMTDCMNPAYAYYSPDNAREAFDWHETNGCEVGVCATMTAGIIVIRRHR